MELRSSNVAYWSVLPVKVTNSFCRLRMRINIGVKHDKTGILKAKR